MFILRKIGTEFCRTDNIWTRCKWRLWRLVRDEIRKNEKNIISRKRSHSTSQAWWWGQGLAPSCTSVNNQTLVWILKFEIFTVCMQTTFQTLSFYCVLMFLIQLLIRNSLRLNRYPIQLSFRWNMKNYSQTRIKFYWILSTLNAW